MKDKIPQNLTQNKAKFEWTNKLRLNAKYFLINHHYYLIPFIDNKVRKSI